MTPLIQLPVTHKFYKLLELERAMSFYEGLYTSRFY